MSNLTHHAEQELNAIGMGADSTDEMNVEMRKSILELVQVFANQGHSGYSASYCADLFSRLVKYEPLTALSGSDEEWFDVSDASGEPMWQNKRCAHVFKDKDGRAYDIDGKIFREPNGSCFTNGDSRVFITFPYTPVREYVDVPEHTDD